MRSSLTQQVRYGFVYLQVPFFSFTCSFLPSRVVSNNNYLFDIGHRLTSTAPLALALQFPVPQQNGSKTSFSILHFLNNLLILIIHTRFVVDIARFFSLWRSLQYHFRSGPTSFKSQNPTFAKMQTPLLLIALAALATARTDLSGCTSSATVAYGGASLIWYVPGTGELCDFLDCGGGRAPPKTTVPGCPLYSGTATYSPSYLAGYNAGAAPSTSTSAPASTTQSSAEITGSSTSAAANSQQTILTGSVTTSSDVSSSGSVSSAVFVTSTTGTGTASGSQSTSTSISSSGTQTSSRGSSTSTSTSSGPSSSATGNSGAKMSLRVWQGVVGAGAAGFAFLL